MCFIDDPKLSSETTTHHQDENTEEAEEPDPEEQLENIRKKLKTDHKKIPIKKSYLHEEEYDEKEKKR